MYLVLKVPAKPPVAIEAISKAWTPVVVLPNFNRSPTCAVPNASTFAVNVIAFEPAATVIVVPNATLYSLGALQTLTCKLLPKAPGYFAIKWSDDVMVTLKKSFFLSQIFFVYT